MAKTHKCDLSMWYSWYFQIHNSKPSKLISIISFQIIKLDENYKKCKQGG